jgi:hypothetical protein
MIWNAVFSHRFCFSFERKRKKCSAKTPHSRWTVSISAWLHAGNLPKCRHARPAMPTLIDGYNLLYAIGRLTTRDAKKSLEGARRWLLHMVRSGHTPGEVVTVVFDAGTAPPRAPGQEEHDGIHVKFARGQTADDLIEELIRGESSPQLLTVVSDDHRIQHAARRRRCPVLGCLDYCERLLQPRAGPSAPATEAPAKPEGSTPEDTQRWLDAFKDFPDDPSWRDGY